MYTICKIKGSWIQFVVSALSRNFRTRMQQQRYNDDDGAHTHVLYASSRCKLNVPPCRRTQYTMLHNVEDASEVLRHNSVIIRRARPQSVPGKMIFRWEGNQFHDGESARLRLEKRRATRRGTRGWRREREREAQREAESGLNSAGCFLFGHDAESIWLAFETALSRHVYLFQ